jgi:hypothetical protein
LPKYVGDWHHEDTFARNLRRRRSERVELWHPKVLVEKGRLGTCRDMRLDHLVSIAGRFGDDDGRPLVLPADEIKNRRNPPIRGGNQAESLS